MKVDLPMQQIRLLQEFDRVGETTLVITENDYDLLIPANQTTLAQGDNHIRLQSTGNDPYIYLLPLHAPLQKAIMKIEIAVPGHSILQVFYATSDAPDYAEDRSVRLPSYRGRNTLFVELPPGVAGRLRIDPGEMPGEYRIYHLSLIHI